MPHSKHSARSPLGNIYPAALMTGVVTLLHLRELLGERLYWRDSYKYFIPAKHYLAETLGAGLLPEWWPHNGMGVPFVASTNFSLFHPTTLAYVVLPFWSAFALQNIAGTAIAIVGAWLLARRLSLPQHAALVAAILYATSGYLIGVGEHTFLKIGAATLPWYLWSLLLASRGGTWRLLLPPLILASIVLCGDVRMVILASLSGVALLVGRRGAGRRVLALGLLSPLVAAGLAGIQLLPSAMVIGETARAHSLALENRWAFDMKHALALVVPAHSRGYIPAILFGAVSLGLAALALRDVRSSRTILTLSLLGAASLWLTLGDAFGLDALFDAVLPVWGRLRYPIKSLPVFLLCASLLAGFGFKKLEKAPGFKVTARTFAGAVAALLVAAALATGADEIQSIGVQALLALVILAVRVRRPGLAVVVLALHGVGMGQAFSQTAHPSFFDPPPLAVALKDNGVGLTGPSFDRLGEYPEAAQQPWVHRRAVGGAELVFGSIFGLPALRPYSPAAMARVNSLLDDARGTETTRRLYGTLGAGFTIETAELLRDGRRPLATDPETGWSLVEVPDAMPRAYAVHRGRAVPHVVAAREALRSGDWVAGEEIVIEGSKFPAEWSSRPGHKAVPWTVADRRDGYARLEGAAPWPGFVVLNEAWAKGWSVSVDGQPAAPLIANGCVRGVEVPAGATQVEWRYRTPGLVAGAWISFVSLLMLVATGLLLARWMPHSRNG